MQIFYQSNYSINPIKIIFASKLIKFRSGMKKILITFLIIVTIIACKTENPKDYMVLSGNIINLEKDTIKLNNIGNAFSEKLAINDDGSFLDTLSIETGYYSFYDGNKVVDLYLTNDRDLQVSYDYKDTTNIITFAGENAGLNNYLLTKGKTSTELYGEKSSILYSLDENDFVTKVKSVKNSLIELLNSAALEESFTSQELKNIHYASVDKLINYESAHRYYTKNPEFKPSDSFNSGIMNIDQNNIDDFKNSSSYRNILQSHCSNLTEDKLNGENEKYDLVYLDVINENVKNETIKNDLLYSNAKYGITYTENLKDFYSNFMAYSTDTVNNNEITKAFNKLKTTAKGELSPKFVNYENFKGGTTSLDDLNGKYVYIDVWATWCGPCKREIPSLKKIEKQYHGKNIEFVSISVDVEKDHGAWKKMIVEKELGGIQLYADKSWNSNFITDYSIKGIPRFILIDPAGKIITPNAPRPSSPKLVDLFTNLGV